jgi:hypothetical protein
MGNENKIMALQHFRPEDFSSIVADKVCGRRDRFMTYVIVA